MTRYSPAHKNLILRIFADVFKGDVAKTARYAHVPERTLRDWLYAAQRAAAASRKSAATATPKVQRRI